MIDFLKDSTEAWLQRIRSPIIGSVGLAFVALNWKALWYLVFADRPVAVKFHFIEMNTTWLSLYLWPILIGLAIAIASPWIKLGGSYIATNPTRRLRRLQSSEASHQRRIQLTDSIAEEELKAKLEEATAKTEAEREKRAIDAAKRIEAASSIEGGSVVVDALVQQRSEASVPDNINVAELVKKLSLREKAIITVMGETQHMVSPNNLTTEQKEEFMLQLSDSIEGLTSIRLEVEMKDSLQQLKSLGIADHDAMREWFLTALGFQVKDELNG